MGDSKYKYMAFALIIGLAGVAFILLIKKITPQNIPLGVKPSSSATTFSTPIPDYTLTLKPLNNSGEEGSVLFKTSNGGKTAIEVSMTRLSNSATSSANPVYIRSGECRDPGEIVMTLDRLKNGKSTTMITETLPELLKKGNLIVTVHKPVTDTYDITSCGELKKS